MPTIRIPGSNIGGGPAPNLPTAGFPEAEAAAKLAASVRGGFGALAEGVQNLQNRQTRVDEIAADEARRAAEKAEAKAEAAAERTDNQRLRLGVSNLEEAQRNFDADALDPDSPSFMPPDEYVGSRGKILSDGLDDILETMATEQGRNDVDTIRDVMFGETGAVADRARYARAREAWEGVVLEEALDQEASAPPPFTRGRYVTTDTGAVFVGPAPDMEALDFSLTQLPPSHQGTRLDLVMNQLQTDTGDAEIANEWLVRNQTTVLGRITDPVQLDRATRTVARAKQAMLRTINSLISENAVSAQEQGRQVALSIAAALQGKQTDADSLLDQRTERTSALLNTAFDAGIIDEDTAKNALLGLAQRQAAVEAAVIKATAMYDLLGNDDLKVNLDENSSEVFTAVWPSLKAELDGMSVPDKATRFNQIMKSFHMNLPSEASNWLDSLDLQSTEGLLVMTQIMAPYVTTSGARLPQSIDRIDAQRGKITLRQGIGESNFRMVETATWGIISLNMKPNDAIALARSEQALAEEELRKSPQEKAIEKEFPDQISVKAMTSAINSKFNENLGTMFDSVSNIDVKKPGNKRFVEVAMRFALADRGLYRSSDAAAINNGISAAEGLFHLNTKTDEWEFMSPRLYETEPGIVDEDVQAQLRKQFGREYESDQYSFVPLPNTDTPLDPSTFTWMVMYEDANGATVPLAIDGQLHTITPTYEGSEREKRDLLFKLLQEREPGVVATRLPLKGEGGVGARNRLLVTRMHHEMITLKGYEHVPALKKVYDDALAQAQAEKGGGDEYRVGFQDTSNRAHRDIRKAQRAVLKEATGGTISGGPREGRLFDVDRARENLLKVDAYKKARELQEKIERGDPDRLGFRVDPTNLGPTLPDAMLDAIDHLLRTNDPDPFVEAMMRAMGRDQ